MAAELSRVLKPVGQFLIITANPEAYAAWTDLYTETKLEGARFEGRIRNDDNSESHDVLYLHTLEEIKASLRAAKLKVRRTETFRKHPDSPDDLYLVLEGWKNS